jgi:hypothetical protein
METTGASSSGPAPPPAGAVKVGKGKTGAKANTPAKIPIASLVTEIKRAIKGDLLPEKDIKTANIIFEKIKLTDVAGNTNGIKKLRGIYGKHLYKNPMANFVF